MLGGRPKSKGVEVYLQLIHFVIQQKLTQHCEAIILQKKKKKKGTKNKKGAPKCITEIRETRLY